MSTLGSGMRALAGIAAVVVVAIIAIAALSSRTTPDPALGSGTSPVSGTRATEPPRAAAIPDANAIALAPARPAQPPKGECLRHVEISDGVAPSIKGFARISTDVVQATVVEVGPSRWRNDTEEPPLERHEYWGDAVMRLVRLSVTHDLAYLGKEGTIVAWIPGGAIGCHSFEVAGYPLDIKVDQSYVLFLNANSAPIASLQAVPKAGQIWPVEGSVANSADLGEVSLQDISSEVAKVLLQTP